MSSWKEELAATLLKLVEIDRALAIHGATYDALRRSFDGANFLGAGIQAQELRNGIHEILDEILDLLGTQMTLKRKIVELERNKPNDT